MKTPLSGSDPVDCGWDTELERALVPLESLPRPKNQPRPANQPKSFETPPKSFEARAQSFEAETESLEAATESFEVETNQPADHELDQELTPNTLESRGNIVVAVSVPPPPTVTREEETRTVVISRPSDEPTLVRSQNGSSKGVNSQRPSATASSGPEEVALSPFAAPLISIDEALSAWTEPAADAARSDQPGLSARAPLEEGAPELPVNPHPHPRRHRHMIESGTLRPNELCVPVQRATPTRSRIGLLGMFAIAAPLSFMLGAGLARYQSYATHTHNLIVARVSELTGSSAAASAARAEGSSKASVAVAVQSANAPSSPPAPNSEAPSVPVAETASPATAEATDNTEPRVIETRSVRVRVIPEQAELWEQGHRLGVGRIIVDVPSGESRELTASLRGHRARMVVVDGNHEKVVIILDPIEKAPSSAIKTAAARSSARAPVEPPPATDVDPVLPHMSLR
ncbi:MAG TPA: hypothetical protein VFQ61_34400 [Polyangiaceae bacterium]|nr:hypothetical protein [Polyangiaceae bacterium]